jgi:NADH-quinone oxidoreductase subunit M
MQNLLLAMLLFILFAVIIVFIFGRRVGSRIGWVAFLTLLPITVFLTLLLLYPVNGYITMEEYTWVPAISLKFGLLIDGLSLPELFMLALIFTVVGLYSTTYMRLEMNQKYPEGIKVAYAPYYGAYLIYFAGVMGAILATNLIELYMFFELALVSSWFLISRYGDKKTALVYFIWTHVGSLFLLSGIFLTGLRVGSYEIADLRLLSGDPIAIWVATAFLLCFFIKMGALGFHAWLPDTYTEAPIPISAVLGATSVCLGTYAVVRLLIPFRSVLFGASSWLELWALVTIIYGGLMALVATDLKRLVAYLSMSQMNYCLLGAFTYVELGVVGAVSYSISHGLAIALLFLMVGSIFYRTKTTDMNQLGGLSGKMPFAVVACIVGFFTIGGVPPMIGFKSKFVLLAGVFQRAFISSEPEFMVAILAVMVTMVTIAYELWAIWRVFFGSLPKHLQDVKESTLIMTLPLLILSLTSIMLGIWPIIIVNPIETAISHLFSLL